jgi:hypothetical protein
MLQRRLHNSSEKLQQRRCDAVRQHKYAAAVGIGTVAETASRSGIDCSTGGSPKWTWVTLSLILTRDAGNTETTYCYTGRRC